MSCILRFKIPSSFEIRVLMKFVSRVQSMHTPETCNQVGVAVGILDDFDVGYRLFLKENHAKITPVLSYLCEIHISSDWNHP